MPYREVTMLETKELLRLWLDGMAIKTIAGYLGLDPKTVRRYIRVGQEQGLVPCARIMMKTARVMTSERGRTLVQQLNRG